MRAVGESQRAFGVALRIEVDGEDLERGAQAGMGRLADAEDFPVLCLPSGVGEGRREGEVPLAQNGEAERAAVSRFQAPPPESWGTKNDSSFSVYASENEPLPPLETK